MHKLYKFLTGCLLLANSIVAQTHHDTITVTHKNVDSFTAVDSVIPIKKKKGFPLFRSNPEKIREGKVLVSPFLFPGYSPDIQYSIAGGAVISFKTNKADSLLPRSSVPVTLTYSTIKSFIASAGFTTFWLHDKLRVNALMQFKVSRDAYYGVGFNNAITTSYPDSTRFWRSFTIIQLRPLWKIKKHVFVGTSLEFSANLLRNVNAYMKKDINYLQYGPRIYNTGIGGILSYDSRDYPQNPYKGIYSTIIYTMYSKNLGGNTNFQALDFDNRFFIPLSKSSVSTLAINFRSRYDFGKAPITSMISLGTSQDLRGIHFGQFRDYFENYLITEYRHKIYHGNGKPSRFGWVAWAGIGAIGDNFNQALFQQALPDFGIGLRFEVQPRLNLRIDFGYAPGLAGNHTGTYFNFLEAY